LVPIGAEIGRSGNSPRKGCARPDELARSERSCSRAAVRWRCAFLLISRGAGDGLWRYADGRTTEIWKGSEGTLTEAAGVSRDGQHATLVRVPVLRGLSGLNVNGADTSLHTPGQVLPTAYLRPIVGMEELWCAALVYDGLQHSRHTLARHTGIGLERKTFTREGVNNTEYPQPSAACRDIAGEIDRPFLIRCCQGGRRGVSARQPLAADAAHA
jgi:hypothetical protein